MPAVVGRNEGLGVRQDQFDERHRCCGAQSVIDDGVLQGLIEHALITRTGEHPITTGDDAAANESLQWWAMTLCLRRASRSSSLTGSSPAPRALTPRGVRLWTALRWNTRSA